MVQTATVEKSAEPKVMPEAEEPAIQPLLHMHFEAVGYHYGDYDATLPVGTPLENALRPEFWTNVVPKLQGNPSEGTRPQVGAIINLRSQDHAFFARLYVRAVRERALTVALIGEPVYFGPTRAKAANGASGYDVRWNVGAKGYEVVRKSDAQIVSYAKDNPTKEDALNWIAEAMKAI